MKLGDRLYVGLMVFGAVWNVVLFFVDGHDLDKLVIAMLFVAVVFLAIASAQRRQTIEMLRATLDRIIGGGR